MLAKRPPPRSDYDTKIAEADIFKTSIETDLIFACFEKNVRSLQTLVNANAEWKVMLSNAMDKITELLGGGR